MFVAIEISLREFLRNYKQYFPIPREGIKILYRAGMDFYLYPQKQTETDKLKIMAQFLSREMKSPTIMVNQQPYKFPEPMPGSQNQQSQQVIEATTTPEVIKNKCEAKKLLPWETACNKEAHEVLVASLKDGNPMSPSDWKTVFLCDIHKGVVESMGGFEVETP